MPTFADMMGAFQPKIAAVFNNAVVSVERPPTSVNAKGHLTGAWSTFASGVSAAVETLGGQERWDAQRSNPTLSHRVTITPVIDGITPAMRIVWGERILNIVSVVDVNGAGTTLEIMCGEKR